MMSCNSQKKNIFKDYNLFYKLLKLFTKTTFSSTEYTSYLHFLVFIVLLVILANSALEDEIKDTLKVRL